MLTIMSALHVRLLQLVHLPAAVSLFRRARYNHVSALDQWYCCTDTGSFDTRGRGYADHHGVGCWCCWCWHRRFGCPRGQGGRMGQHNEADGYQGSGGRKTQDVDHSDQGCRLEVLGRWTGRCLKCSMVDFHRIVPSSLQAHRNKGALFGALVR